MNKSLLSSSLLAVTSVTIVAISLLFTTKANAVAATNDMTFSQYAVHPEASRAGFDLTSVNYYTGAHLCTETFCSIGESITDMGVTSDGHLIAGYGDYTFNVDSFGVAAGKVGINPLDLSNGTWGTFTPTGTESNDVIREIGGALYLPRIDPSDPGGSKSGYETNYGGSWHFVQLPGGVHQFDIASLTNTNNDLWVFGSESYPGSGQDEGRAVAWHSSDGGVTWNKAMTDVSIPISSTTNFERYYWGAAINGKMYMQADDTQPQTPMRVFDSVTNTWGSVPFQSRCDQRNHQVVTYDNAIICGSDNDGLYAFDGMTTNLVPFPNDGTNYFGAIDYYIDNGYLYVLTGSNDILRTTSLSEPWQYVGSGPGMSNSIAVYNDMIYVATISGEISRSNETITEALTPTASAVIPETIPLDRATHTLSISGNNFNAATVTIGGVNAPVSAQTATSITATIDTALLSHSDTTYAIVVTNGSGTASTSPVSLVGTPVTPVMPITPGNSTAPSQPTSPVPAKGQAGKNLAATGDPLTLIVAGSIVLVAIGGVGFLVTRNMCSRLHARR